MQKKIDRLVKINIRRPSQFPFDFYSSKMFVKEFAMITINKLGLSWAKLSQSWGVGELNVELTKAK